MVFTFTLMIALSHAVAIGAPLFLFRLWRKSIDAGSCVFLGSLIGVIPAGILTYPVPYPGSPAWISDVPILAGELIRAVTSAGYIRPLLYCGLVGALGGLVFWMVLRSTGELDPYRG